MWILFFLLVFVEGANDSCYANDTTERCFVDQSLNCTAEYRALQPSSEGFQTAVELLQGTVRRSYILYLPILPHPLYCDLYLFIGRDTSNIRCCSSVPILTRAIVSQYLAVS